MGDFGVKTKKMSLKVKKIAKKFGGFKISSYLCIVFFIVLDLRLTKFLGAAAPIFFVYIPTRGLLTAHT